MKEKIKELELQLKKLKQMVEPTKLWSFGEIDGNFQYIGEARWESHTRVVIRFNGRKEYNPHGLKNARLVVNAPRMYNMLKEIG